MAEALKETEPIAENPWEMELMVLGIHPRVVYAQAVSSAASSGHNGRISSVAPALSLNFCISLGCIRMVV